ncbi:hypothetical protein Tco_0356835 [Tanacetum coccineum]
MRSNPPSNVDKKDSKVINPQRSLEQEFLDYEAKIITTFSVVDNMKEQRRNFNVKPFTTDEIVANVVSDLYPLLLKPSLSMAYNLFCFIRWLLLIGKYGHILILLRKMQLLRMTMIPHQMLSDGRIINSAESSMSSHYNMKCRWDTDSNGMQSNNYFGEESSIVEAETTSQSPNVVKCEVFVRKVIELHDKYLAYVNG